MRFGDHSQNVSHHVGRTTTTTVLPPLYWVPPPRHFRMFAKSRSWMLLGFEEQASGKHFPGSKISQATRARGSWKTSFPAARARGSWKPHPRRNEKKEREKQKLVHPQRECPPCHTPYGYTVVPGVIADCMLPCPVF